METKYGREISNEGLVEYFKSLTGEIYKSLPLFEQCEGSGNFSIYVETLLIELHSSKRMLFVDDKDFIKLITNIEPLLELKNHAVFRRQVFKCTNLCHKLIEKYIEKGVEINGV